MKCPVCSKVNVDSARFCKECGTPFSSSSTGYKACPNGHTYDPKLPACPYCPQENFESTTVEDNISPFPNKQGPDETLIVNQGSNNRIPSSNDDRTQIVSSNREQPAGGQSGARKLVGWLVTYELNPMGTDFRIYEGRTKVGKGVKNEVIIHHPTVSDEHAVLLFRDNMFILEDKLSTNGTGVNGISLEDKVKIKNFDILRFGSVYCKFVAVGEIVKK